MNEIFYETVKMLNSKKCIVYEICLLECVPI